LGAGSRNEVNFQKDNAMVISIKNDEVERRIRRLAELRGISLTEAIDQAVSEAIGTEWTVAKRGLEAVRADIERLRQKYGLDRFQDADWSAVNADMYDEEGLPR
jgi:hypothetical protein